LGSDNYTVLTPDELLFIYEKIKEPFFTKRRFKHSDILPLLKKSSLEQEVAGYSFEGRPIHKLKWGKGKISVLLWSQMHGDEATATMALFDIFRFIETIDNDFSRLLAENLMVHFVPMLNPDGTERFSRRTAQQIDMNRDALALVCPESRLLKQLQNEISPDFSFNLHDQDVRWAAGETPNQASISFLATAFDKTCSWNSNRTKAMQVICEMNDILQTIIPDKVGRFSDEFEPRAFGDNIQKWGSSLILIESGGNGEDREKAELRKLNFMIILKALESIAKQNYGWRTLPEYESIPLNTKCLFHLLIKNVTLEGCRMDIGINLQEMNNADASSYSLESTIEDMGDLSTFYGIRTLDASGLDIEALERFSEILTLKNFSYEQTEAVRPEKRANFALTKSGIPQYFIINGILYPLP
jgi:hypothetical protein